MGASNYFQQLSDGRDFLLIGRIPRTLFRSLQIDFALCDYHLHAINLPGKFKALVLYHEKMRIVSMEC